MKCVWCHKQIFKNQKHVTIDGLNYHKSCPNHNSKCASCKKQFEVGNWPVKYKNKFYHSDCRDRLVNKIQASSWVSLEPEVSTGPTTSELIKFAAKESAINTILFAKNTTEAAKNIFREAEIRSGKYPKVLTEDKAYEIALTEIEEDKAVRGLLAKAISLSDGDEKKHKAKYIQLRVQQLLDIKSDIDTITPKNE